MIFEILSSATPSRPSVCMSQWKLLMSCCKWATFVSFIGFQKLDGLDLEGLVSAETTIFLEVGLVVSGSRSQLRVVTILV